MTYLKDSPDFTKIKKVLIIKLRNLGDVVLATASISVLKKRFPHLKIDFLVNEEASGLIEGLKDIDNVLTYKRPKSKGLFKKISAEKELFLSVLKKKYDLTINLTEGDKGNLLSLLSNASFKVGQENSSYSRFLTHLYKKTGFKRHSVEKDLDALRRLGIYPKDDEKRNRNLTAIDLRGKLYNKLLIKKCQLILSEFKNISLLLFQ